MASADKGKYVVLFTSGNFVFFKHKNDKGIYCPKSILNSSRQVLKDDIYDLFTESVTQKHHREYPDMPEAAVLIATKAKYLKTPRIIHGVGTMKKISTDGEYGFVEYQDGRSTITAFVTRITVKPQIEKGGMLKFFSTGCKVRFVAKEQPPSGMFNIEWRCVTATDMKHEISESNFEKVTPVSAAVPVARPLVPPSPARPPPAAAAAASSSAMSAPPGLPTVPVTATQSNGVGGVSASSSSSSVVNGVSFAARASQQLPAMPEAVANAVHRAVGARRASPIQIDDSLPTTCPAPRLFALSDKEKAEEWGYSSSASSLRSPALSSSSSSWPISEGSFLPLQLHATTFPSLSENLPQAALAQSVYDVWPHYKRDDERSLEAFEAELSQLSHVASALHGGDPHVCPIFFASRVS